MYQMRCPTLSELPPPPLGKTGWPWTEETLPLADNCLHDDWPKISIVTASRNQGEFIEEAIRSVLLQGYPNIEYIIIDGSSRDNSVEIIRKYESWLAHWVTEPDRSAVEASSKGFARATGELFGLMCADDAYLPEGLLRLARLHRQNPACVLWVGACRDIDLKGNTIKIREPKVCETAVGDWGGSSWFSTVACIYAASAFRSAGGLDGRFAYAGDLDLWIKLSRIGLFALTRDLVSVSRVNPESISHHDIAMGFAANIATNFVNGCGPAAKMVLERYVEFRAQEVVRRTELADILRLKGWLNVAGALLGQLPSKLRRKIADVFSVGLG